MEGNFDIGLVILIVSYFVIVFAVCGFIASKNIKTIGVFVLAGIICAVCLLVENYFIPVLAIYLLSVTKTVWTTTRKVQERQKENGGSIFRRF